MAAFRKISGGLRDTRGNVAIIAGLTLPLIVGFCGLGGETAFWYFKQRDLQGAADVAAYNGAIALRGGTAIDAIRTQASVDATVVFRIRNDHREHSTDLGHASNIQSGRSHP